jgi:hypothetical protein
MKRLLAVLVFPAVLLLLVPSGALADASVVQDSCITVGTAPPYNVWTYFTVVNFSLPEPVCGLTLVPEPLPPVAGCEIIGTQAPPGWVGQVTPQGGASWYALIPGCIGQNSSLGEFAFYLDPAFCCYVVSFYGMAGNLLLEQEECFTCQKVPTEQKNWGHIKQLYE